MHAYGTRTSCIPAKLEVDPYTKVDLQRKETNVVYSLSSLQVNADSLSLENRIRSIVLHGAVIMTKKLI